MKVIQKRTVGYTFLMYILAKYLAKRKTFQQNLHYSLKFQLNWRKLRLYMLFRRVLPPMFYLQ